jgi:hypothetical protein
MRNTHTIRVTLLRRRSRLDIGGSAHAEFTRWSVCAKEGLFQPVSP